MTLPKSSSKQDPEFTYDTVFANTDSMMINEREHPDAEARFAMQLLSHHGVLMGTPDGEDSAGRQKLDYLPPAKVVGRALDIAQAFYVEARKRGCMLLLPTQTEKEKALAERKEAAERRKEDALQRAVEAREKVKSDA